MNIDISATGTKLLESFTNNSEIEIQSPIVVAETSDVAILGVNYKSDNNTKINDVTGLMNAVIQGDLNELSSQLRNFCSPNVQDKGTFTAVMYAAMNGQLSCLDMLIAAGSDMNIRDKNGWTAVIWSVVNDHPQILEFLISRGANIRITDNISQWSALHHACSLGRLDMALSLVEHGCDIWTLDAEGLTAVDLCTSIEMSDAIVYAANHPKRGRKIQESDCLDKLACQRMSVLTEVDLKGFPTGDQDIVSSIIGQGVDVFGALVSSICTSLSMSDDNIDPVVVSADGDDTDETTIESYTGTSSDSDLNDDAIGRALLSALFEDDDYGDVVVDFTKGDYNLVGNRHDVSDFMTGRRSRRSPQSDASVVDGDVRSSPLLDDVIMFFG